MYKWFGVTSLFMSAAVDVTNVVSSWGTPLCIRYHRQPVQWLCVKRTWHETLPRLKALDNDSLYV